MKTETKLPNFQLKRDWFIETDILGIKNKTLLFNEGYQFKPTETGEYHIIYGGWSEMTPNVGGRMILSLEEMRTADDNGELLFQEIIEDLKFTIQEVDELEEDITKNWRIQVDVKTSAKKLKEIQIVLEKSIREVL